MASQDSLTLSAKSTSKYAATGARSLCAFWLGERCFALETSYVGEVVTVEDHIALPLAPPAVRGIFNLRGEPVPLVATEEALGLGLPARPRAKHPSALVLREAELVVGLIVDRMQGVLALDRGELSAVASAVDDPGLLGFLELGRDEARTVVSVLSPAHLIERLSALRYARSLVTS
jgi:purine-binding chemotaxis protein CheW